MTVFAGTGHRPPKIGGYSASARLRVSDFADAVLAKFNPSLVISGMALGWDQALASAAFRRSIPFVAAVPFKGQESKWPEASQNMYHFMLSKAQEVVYVSEPGFSAHKMQVRNEWMVDHSDYVLALWDGSSGGTMNCIRYANSVGVTVMNVWRPFVEYQRAIVPAWL